MSRDVMQQALDALKSYDGSRAIDQWDENIQASKQWEREIRPKAISALRAALAQPEPETAKPLTDEQIENVLRDHYPCESYGDHYRLVKAAHGIRTAPAVRRARPDDTEGGEL